MSDLISRRAALDAIMGEPTDAHYPAWYAQRIKLLPSATCDDCIWHTCNYNKIDWDGEDGYISKRDAINAIENTDAEITAEEWDELTNAIKLLPSAEPKTGAKIVPKEESDMYIAGYRDGHDDATKTARWIKGDDYVCDYCGYHMVVGSGVYNYCPSCGKRMLGEDGEEE